MILPTPIQIPRPRSAEAQDHILRAMGIHLAVFGTIIGGGLLALLIAMCGVREGMAAWTACLACSFGVALLAERLRIDMSTMVLGMMALVLAGGAGTAAWLTLHARPTGGHRATIVAAPVSQGAAGRRP